jgi:NDP-sugar pyrophosphorylase family protein
MDSLNKADHISESPVGILLVGGRGTRLAPLTDLAPKPMLPVGGVPFTLHQILQAKAAGIKHIVLATSYLAEVFEPFFGNNQKCLIYYSHHCCIRRYYIHLNYIPYILI